MTTASTFDAKEIELLGQIISSQLRVELQQIDAKVGITQEQLNTFHVSISQSISEMKKDLKDIEAKHDKHVDDLYSKVNATENSLRVEIDRNYVRKEVCNSVEEHVINVVNDKGTELRKEIEASFDRKMRFTQFIVFLATSIMGVVIYLIKHTKG